MERVLTDERAIPVAREVGGEPLARLDRGVPARRIRGHKTRGWRRIASAVWRGPRDPQIYGTLEVDATPLLEVIERGKRAGAPVTITHLVGRAMAHALEKVPEVNVRLVGGEVVPRPSVDLFFITAVEGGSDLSGVKVVRSNEKSAKEIALELHQRAHVLKTGHDPGFERSKRIMNALPIPILRPLLRFIAWRVGQHGRPIRMLGLEASPFGSAMVSSVGMLGLPNGFSPLAWMYQVPILVLAGELTDKPMAVDGRVEIRPTVSLCVSLDHRYMDGWHISGLVRAFREYLREPARFEKDI